MTPEKHIMNRDPRYLITLSLADMPEEVSSGAGRFRFSERSLREASMFWYIRIPRLRAQTRVDTTCLESFVRQQLSSWVAVFQNVLAFYLSVSTACCMVHRKVFAFVIDNGRGGYRSKTRTSSGLATLSTAGFSSLQNQT